MSKREEVKRYKAVQLAFSKDCEKLLEKYLQLQTFSFDEFAKIWKEMSFSLVFSGKSSYDEFRHFTEVFLFESKKYHVYSKNIYLKTGAFYLMYGLYYKQPIRSFVKIRMTKDEFVAMSEFIKEMKERQKLEPLYVYCKMMVDDAFDFVYTQSILTPDLRHFKENFIMENTIFENDPVKSIETPLLQLLANKDIITVNNEYQKLLSEFMESNKDTNLMVFKNDILDDIKKIYDASQNTDCNQGTSNEGVDKGKETDIGEKRKSLKRKAMCHKK